MLRLIQAGILICLMAITGLLFAIYRQQAVLTANDVERIQAEEPLKAELEAVEGIQAPEPEPVVVVEAVPEPPAKPRPTSRSSFVAPKPTPAPQPQPAPTPALAEPPESSVTEEPTVIAMAEKRAKPEAFEPQVVEEPQPATEPLAAAKPELAEPLLEETPAEPREPRMVTLPSGQRLMVRIDNTLSTSRNRVDDTFFATLDEPIIVDGLIIADKGARLQGRITESQQAGRVKGLARLACELTHLDTDDGQRVAIQTSNFGLEGPSSRNDDLKKVAMGAGAGAILGAIFGGGKGAAIGAASGAGAGAGTAAATRGEPAVIEPETRLEFRLAGDVTITEKL